jgi:hypothetical protein
VKLRSIKIDRTLVPIFNGNRDLPANEQVVIHFSRIPGTSERANYKNFVFSQDGKMGLSYNDNLMVSTFVSKVENLELSTGEKIKTGRDLATASSPDLSELFTEIRDYLFPDDEDFGEGESRA